MNITSDGGGTAAANGYTLPLNKWTHITVVRNAAGLIDFYENGILLFDDVDTGTPVAGGDIKLNIEPTSFRGLYGETIIVDGLWTAEEVSQTYTSSKNLYYP